MYFTKQKNWGKTTQILQFIAYIRQFKANMSSFIFLFQFNHFFTRKSKLQIVTGITSRQITFFWSKFK